METRDRIRGRSAVGAGEIAQAQSEANGDDDAGAQRRASAEPFEKGHLRALRAHQMRTGPPGAAGNTGDQNRLETSRERSSALNAVKRSEFALSARTLCVAVANAYHSYGLLGDRDHCFARTLEGFGLPPTSIPLLKAEIDGFQGSLVSRGFPAVSSR